MELLTDKLKKELFKGLNSLVITGECFEHCLEYEPRTFAKYESYVETENLNITIELEEEALWVDYDEYNVEDLNVLYLEVTCENGEVNTNDLSDEELLNNINY